MTEPYMIKYIKVVFKFLFRQQYEVAETKNPDYIDLYHNDSLLEGANLNNSNKDDFYNRGGPGTHLNNNNLNLNIDMNVINSHPNKEHKNVPVKSKVSTSELSKMADTLNVFTKEMEASDFFIRMIGITVSTEEDKQYDFDPQFGNKMKAYLPWEDDAYNGKSKLSEYTHKNLPEWLTKDTSK
jgi:hypothetical protein